MSEKYVWVYRSYGGDYIDICPGARRPWSDGVLVEVPFGVARALGFVGLRKGQAIKYKIEVTAMLDEDKA